MSVQSLRVADQDEELINLSGKQRMLSQRTLMFAHRYLVTEQSIYSTETEATIKDFAAAHEALIRAAEGDPNLMELYAPGEPDGLDAQVDVFVAGTLALLSASNDPVESNLRFREIDFVGRDVLLRRLDAAVSAFEARANSRADWLKNVQRAAFVSSIILLLIELFFIFLPLHRWIMQTISRLNREANNDALTGLVNRKHFGEALPELASQSQSGTTLAILAMDLDGFKAVNDALGHPAGDELLQIISDLLRDKSEKLGEDLQPLIARMGGDEFMMACRLPLANATHLIEEFSEAVLSHLQEPITLNMSGTPTTCVVGMSLGYALETGAKGSLDRLVSNADIALYASKKSGKGRLTAFREELRVEAERRLRLETELRRAVMGGHFHPYFQGQVDLVTGELVAFEVIAQWSHSENGLVPLDSFASDAEQIGVLDMIEATIILTALEATKSLVDEGLAVPRLSLNVSAQSLRDSEFVSNLLSTVNMFELSAAEISIEIKETVLMANAQDPAIGSIHRLSEAGFGVIIDDFGTGYASLNAMSDLQFKGVKIASRLVSSADQASGLKVLRATIAVGKSMGLDVCAQGVRKPQEAAMLRDMGCDFAQGACFGGPVDVAGARALLVQDVPSAKIVPPAAS